MKFLVAMGSYSEVLPSTSSSYEENDTDDECPVIDDDGQVDPEDSDDECPLADDDDDDDETPREPRVSHRLINASASSSARDDDDSSATLVTASNDESGIMVLRDTHEAKQHTSPYSNDRVLRRGPPAMQRSLKSSNDGLVPHSRAGNMSFKAKNINVHFQDGGIHNESHQTDNHEEAHSQTHNEKHNQIHNEENSQIHNDQHNQTHNEEHSQTHNVSNQASPQDSWPSLGRMIQLFFYFVVTVYAGYLVGSFWCPNQCYQDQTPEASLSVRDIPSNSLFLNKLATASIEISHLCVPLARKMGKGQDDNLRSAARQLRDGAEHLHWVVEDFVSERMWDTKQLEALQGFSSNVSHEVSLETTREECQGVAHTSSASRGNSSESAEKRQGHRDQPAVKREPDACRDLEGRLGDLRHKSLAWYHGRQDRFLEEQDKLESARHSVKAATTTLLELGFSVDPSLLQGRVIEAIRGNLAAYLETWSRWAEIPKEDREWVRWVRGHDKRMGGIDRMAYGAHGFRAYEVATSVLSGLELWNEEALVEKRRWEKSGDLLRAMANGTDPAVGLTDQSAALDTVVNSFANLTRIELERIYATLGIHCGRTGEQ